MKAAASLFFAFSSLFAQSPAFEAVSIKPSPPNNGSFTRGCRGGPGTNDPVLWRCTNATVSMLIIRAYDIKHYQLTAPDSASDANFEISASLRSDTTQAEFRAMIRNLLSDRFKLAFHWGKKEVSLYDLVVAKGGPKMKESVDKPAGDANDDLPGPAAKTDADGFPVIPKDCSGCMAINAAGKARYQAIKEPLKSFADMLGNQLGMPVRDRTGLTGKYDITLSWTSGGGIGRRADPDAPADLGISIEAAVQQQLGLKLVSSKGPIDTIVVDKVERNPSGN
ncbi:MAG TPA: TIGR03435 family protein [Bryobacteraceae bacterium]|nr:TIGR03435 family protein [Bryobacteraceae bacterium]